MFLIIFNKQLGLKKKLTILLFQTECIGYFGEGCSRPCPSGFYGRSCTTQCNCSVNETCNQFVGCISNLSFTCGKIKTKISKQYSFNRIFIKFIQQKKMELIVFAHLYE